VQEIDLAAALAARRRGRKRVAHPHRPRRG
jgi:hypothetical protein